MTLLVYPCVRIHSEHSEVKDTTSRCTQYTVYTVHSCKMEMEHSNASVTEWIPRGGGGGGGGGGQSEHSRQAFPAVVL